MANSTASLSRSGHGVLSKDKSVYFSASEPFENIIPVFPITVPHPSIGTSMKLHVPVEISEEERGVNHSSRAYTDYLNGHLEYKRKAEPWLSEAELKESATRELKSMQLGYPGFEDEATVRCLTCYFVYICEIDTILETCPIGEARECTKRCIAILDGQKIKEPNLETTLCKAETLTAAFRDTINLLLPRATATAALESTKTMLAGQLPERVFLESNAPFPDIQAYLELREHPFGLLPHLFMVEHYFMPGGAPPHRRTDVDLLMKQVVYAAILQNDAGGLEKDIKTGNLSNTILILAKLAGQSIQKAEDVLDLPLILRQAEELHDGLVYQVIVTYLRIQRQAASEGERLFSRVLLDLCRRQLQWTVGSPRYDISLQ